MPTLGTFPNNSATLLSLFFLLFLFFCFLPPPFCLFCINSVSQPATPARLFVSLRAERFPPAHGYLHSVSTHRASLKGREGVYLSMTADLASSFSLSCLPSPSSVFLACMSLHSFRPIHLVAKASSAFSSSLMSGALHRLIFRACVYTYMKPACTYLRGCTSTRLSLDLLLSHSSIRI